MKYLESATLGCKDLGLESQILRQRLNFRIHLWQDGSGFMIRIHLWLDGSGFMIPIHFCTRRIWIYEPDPFVTRRIWIHDPVSFFVLDEFGSRSALKLKESKALITFNLLFLSLLKFLQMIARISDYQNPQLLVLR